MRRRLILLNLALLALVAAAAWRLRVNWMAGRVEERRVLGSSVKSSESPAPAPLRSPRPAVAADYSDVAQQMLFDRDRNPKVIVEVAPAKPMPALPLAYGMMDMGDGPVVILSEKPGAANRSYSPGEKVGSFVLAAIEGDELVFDWEGQEVRRKFQDLKPQAGSPATGGGGAQAAPAPASAKAAVQSVGALAPAETGPGLDLTGDLKACQPNDTSPPGTVRDGFRKVVNKTPFGMSCHWEPVK
ncbi:MAG: hypothetical protein ACE141_01145 [Bryobacteraceae bacterium]